MNILLDTCDALWFFSGDAQLDPEKLRLLEEPSNIIFFSAVSSAEIAIKHSIDKLPLPEAPATYIPKLRRRHHLAELPLMESLALLLDTLPLIHRDPFDRQLICQSIAHNLTFMTSDPIIHPYPGLNLI